MSASSGFTFYAMQWQRPFAAKRTQRCGCSAPLWGADPGSDQTNRRAGGRCVPAPGVVSLMAHAPFGVMGITTLSCESSHEPAGS